LELRKADRVKAIESNKHHKDAKRWLNRSIPSVMHGESNRGEPNANHEQGRYLHRNAVHPSFHGIPNRWELTPFMSPPGRDAACQDNATAITWG
jgi:hypothetical protein